MLNSLLAQAAAHNTPDVTSLKQDAAAQAAVTAVGGVTEDRWKA